MRYIKLFCRALFIGLLLSPLLSYAQVNDLAPKTTTTTSDDSLITIEILSSRKLEFKKINDSTQLQILSGDVKLKQGKTLFDCDSCVIDNSANTFEAWGHVHINDSDTANVYSGHLRYLISKKMSYLDGGVKLTDGKGTLTTPDLEYDMTTNIGIYKHGGKVINEKTILTSREGYYYTDLKDVYFKHNVELKDPAYFIKTDSLLYNTESGSVRFIAETFIKDSSGRIIETKEGYYNQQTRKAEFGQRPTIHDGKTTIIANRIAFDDSLGTSQAEGNVVVVDSVQGTTILAGQVFRNNKSDAILATKKPLMIVKQENDSIYITADTLFSARLSDRYPKKDSVAIDTLKEIKVVNLDNSDSTNHNIETKKHVNDSINNSADTLFSPRLSDPHPEKDSVLPDTLKETTVIDKDSINRYIETKRNFPDSISNPAGTLFSPRISDRYQRKDSVKINTLKGATVINKESINRNIETKKNLSDSINNTADTLISPRLSDRHPEKDSILIDTLKGNKVVNVNDNDSTNRYFEAYRHVRIFSDSLQAVCDSMFYSFKDSIFRLYQDPVLWAKGSQITGDTILFFTKNKKADRVKVVNNSFMANILDPGIFNQIKSSRLDAYFKNGTMDSVRASGLAECIYFIQDDDSAYTGINESKSDIMDIYFASQQLRKVVFRSSVTGTIWPMKQKDPKEMLLPKFRWLEARRPKTKFELFE